MYTAEAASEMSIIDMDQLVVCARQNLRAFSPRKEEKEGLSTHSLPFHDLQSWPIIIFFSSFVVIQKLDGV
jgi:hypothetical protein